jgi:Parkin co-regulated protein
MALDTTSEQRLCPCLAGNGFKQCATCQAPIETYSYREEQARLAQKNEQKNATIALRCENQIQRRESRPQRCERRNVHDMLVDTLDLLTSTTGPPAVAAIKRAIPTYDTV